MLFVNHALKKIAGGSRSFCWGLDDTNRPSNYSCPTFVHKHGELGRTMAGWLHKVFATHIFPLVFPRIIFLWWAVLKGVASSPIHLL